MSTGPLHCHQDIKMLLKLSYLSPRWLSACSSPSPSTIIPSTILPISSLFEHYFAPAAAAAATRIYIHSCCCICICICSSYTELIFPANKIVNSQRTLVCFVWFHFVVPSFSFLRKLFLLLQKKCLFLPPLLLSRDTGLQRS